MAPLGWKYYGSLATGCGVVLWEARYPGSFFARFLAMLMVLLFGAYIAVRHAIRRHLFNRYAAARPASGYKARPIVLLVAIGVLFSVSFYFEIPMRVAFQISEPAMRRRAEVILATGSPSSFAGSSTTGEWVGLFYFDSVTLLGSRKAVFFYSREGEFFTDEGWTFSPSGGTPEAPIGEAGPAEEASFGGQWFQTRLSW
jgi:hypothetical protein